MSNNKLDISGVTRPSEFSTNGKDVSQNTVNSNLLTNSVTLNVTHKDVAGTLDISGYSVKYSVQGDNDDSGVVEKTATNKGAHLSNNDVLIDNLQFRNSVYDISLNMFNVHDMSNAYVSTTAFTRPRDFSTNGHDVSQNLTTTYTNRINMAVFNSQLANCLDISGYNIKYSARGNADVGSIVKSATNKGADQTNVDISINNLTRPNTVYDMSVNLFNIYYDVSNSFIDISGHTKPSDFVANDISQNIGSSTSSKIVLKINNSQLANSIDISGYSVDYSGNNGTNATTGTQHMTATNKNSNETNNNVEVTDLSSNTLYNLDTNLSNIYDISNSKLSHTGVTRPSNLGRE